MSKNIDVRKTWWNLKDYQDSGKGHPLTCNNNSFHSKLVPYVTPDRKLILHCQDCDCEQNYIPEGLIVYKDESERFEINNLEMKLIFDEEHEMYLVQFWNNNHVVALSTDKITLKSVLDLENE